MKAGLGIIITFVVLTIFTATCFVCRRSGKGTSVAKVGMPVHLASDLGGREKLVEPEGNVRPPERDPADTIEWVVEQKVLILPLTPKYRFSRDD